LRVGDPLVKPFGTPVECRGLEPVRIRKILDLPCLAPDHAFQIRALAQRLGFAHHMAYAAISFEQGLAIVCRGACAKAHAAEQQEICAVHAKVTHGFHARSSASTWDTRSE